MDTPVHRILWWALVASLLVYLVVAFVAAPPRGTGIPLVPLASAFAGISLVTAVGTGIYRRHALAGPIRRGELDPDTPEGRQRAFQPFLLNLVLSESVGVYGLVLAFLTGRGAWAVPFGLLALLLMALHRPTAPDLVPPRGTGTPGRPPPIG